MLITAALADVVPPRLSGTLKLNEPLVVLLALGTKVRRPAEMSLAGTTGFNSRPLHPFFPTVGGGNPEKTGNAGSRSSPAIAWRGAAALFAPAGPPVCIGAAGTAGNC